MKIEEHYPVMGTYFSDLESGDIFKFTIDDPVYMKIDDYALAGVPMSRYINLENADLICTRNDSVFSRSVIKLNGELNVYMTIK